MKLTIEVKFTNPYEQSASLFSNCIWHCFTNKKTPNFHKLITHKYKLGPSLMMYTLRVLSARERSAQIY